MNRSIQGDVRLQVEEPDCGDHQDQEPKQTQSRPGPGDPPRPLKSTALPARLSDLGKIGNLHEPMAESAPDLSARCKPLDFDDRTAIRTGERLVHTDSLDRPGNATMSRMRDSRETCRGPAPARRNLSRCTTGPRPTDHHPRRRPQTAATRVESQPSVCWRELELSDQSDCCSVQWFISQVSTSPSIWLFRRWVEG